jgi:molybdopterin/thiamine biosynthesis adenylyltransferase
MKVEQTQRTRELIQRLTGCSLSEVGRWGMIQGRVAVVLGREASFTKNGQLAFFTAINLLARLHPVVTEIDVHIETDGAVLVHAPLFDGYKLSHVVQHFAASLNSPVAIALRPESSYLGDAVVALTAGTFHSGMQISFGSDGWNLFLDSGGPCSFSDRFNSVGSMSAACLAASEAFKRVFIMKANRLDLHPDSVPPMPLLNGRSSISTLVYAASADDVPNPDLPTELDIGRTTVVGVGAGGGACLYALATLPLYGELWAIDPDVVNPHNLNRYVYATDEDARTLRKKVNVLNQFLSSRILKCCSFDTPFLDFKSAHPDWPRDLVVSTVDTAEARHAIQWEIPRIILDAAVSQSTFYVHRVELGQSACLKCTHGASSEQTDIVRAISAVIGMDYGEVCGIYFDNMPLTEETARHIGQNVIPRGIRAPTKGMTLRDWVMLHCGQLKLTAGSGMTLPIPFATVLPGILLAGEIIKERYFPTYVVKYRVNHDVFGLPSDWLVTPLNPKQDCPLCGDEAVKKIYRNLYSKSGTR